MEKNAGRTGVLCFDIGISCMDFELIDKYFWVSRYTYKQ